jgi:hypothetical protein
MSMAKGELSLVVVKAGYNSGIIYIFLIAFIMDCNNYNLYLLIKLSNNYFLDEI